MRIARLTFSISVLLLLPLAAAAGPITLSYSAKVLDNTGAHLALPASGTITLDRQPIGNWSGSLTMFWPHEGIPPVGMFDGQSYSSSDQFRVRLTLSDPVSGQSGAITISGWEDTPWDFRAGDFPWSGWRSEATDYTLTASARRLTLNGMDYNFSPTDDSDVSVNALTITASKQTPEPGTLVLAAGGLFSVAGVRRWRRGR